MKFKTFITESRFSMKSVYDDAVKKESEKDLANEFMNNFGGNIFTVDGYKFVWKIHAMSRFIERKMNPNVVQKLLEKNG